MDKSIETKYTNFMCAICFSSLPNEEELYKHVCSQGKTIFLNEGINLSNDDFLSKEIVECDNVILDDYNEKLELDIPQPKSTVSKNPNKNVAMWTDNSTLALLTCYETRKEDLDHPTKRGKVWALIANDLSELGYKFSGEQVRWKFNTLTRKYKDCIDNNKKTGAAPMTFKFFDYIENIIGDRKTVRGQSTISSTFANCKKEKSKSIKLAQNNTFAAQESSSSIDDNKLSNISSSVTSTDTAKIYKNLSKSREMSKNKQAIEKMALSNTETVCSSSVSNTEKNKRPQHGSGNRTATSKMELEKQWLQYLKNVTDKDKIKKEKQEAYEKRKSEEVQIKKKFMALKEKQLTIKQDIAERKQEEAEEWHRKKLNIEKQKCRLLRELLGTRTMSDSKRFKTDENSSDED